MALFVAGSAGATVVGIGDVTDNGDGSFFIASGADLGSGTLPADVEAALRLDPLTLEDFEEADLEDDGDVLNASAIYRLITVGDNTDVQFSWTWNTNEPFFPEGGDFAFVSLSNSDGFVAGAILADVFSNFDGDSGTFSFNTSFFGAGTYRLGIGVADVEFTGPAFNDSFLTIGPILKTPAPGSLILLALGLIGLGAARRT